MGKRNRSNKIKPAAAQVGVTDVPPQAVPPAPTVEQPKRPWWRRLGGR